MMLSTLPSQIKAELRTQKVEGNKTPASCLRTPASITGFDVVTCARTLKDTPFKHQGRLPHTGVDCIGVPLLVGWTLGVLGTKYNPQNYSRIPDGSLIPNLEEICKRQCLFDEGLIAVFKISRQPHHVGIMTKFRDSWGLIHAYQEAGRVCEHELNSYWRNRMVDLFSFPGVSYSRL